jgi:hypothetical protein
MLTEPQLERAVVNQFDIRIDDDRLILVPSSNTSCMMHLSEHHPQACHGDVYDALGAAHGCVPFLATHTPVSLGGISILTQRVNLHKVTYNRTASDAMGGLLPQRFCWLPRPSHGCTVCYATNQNERAVCHREGGYYEGVELTRGLVAPAAPELTHPGPTVRGCVQSLHIPPGSAHCVAVTSVTQPRSVTTLGPT